MSDKNLYEALGLAKGASDVDIKKAYRKLALKYHPDNKKTGDEKKFKEATFAYEILSDPAKRKQYDTYGSNAFQNGGGAGGQGFGGFGDASGFSMNFEDLGDLFENFFGRQGGGRRNQRQTAKQGRDIEAQVNITFDEMVKGTKKDINFEVYQSCDDCLGKGYKSSSDVESCSICHGTGEVTEIAETFFGRMQQSKVCHTCQGSGKHIKNKCKNCNGEGRKMKSVNLTIQIPAGVEDKTVLRLTGKGEAGANGAASGDLYVRVGVENSKKYKRMKMDLFVEKEIDILQAILGDIIDVETPYEKKQVKLPSGSLHGQKIKIQGFGLPRAGGYEKGDLYVEIKVVMPDKLSKSQYNAYLKLAQEKGIKVQPQVKTSWL